MKSKLWWPEGLLLLSGCMGAAVPMPVVDTTKSFPTYTVGDMAKDFGYPPNEITHKQDGSSIYGFKDPKSGATLVVSYDKDGRCNVISESTIVSEPIPPDLQIKGSDGKLRHPIVMGLVDPDKAGISTKCEPGTKLPDSGL